MFYLVLMAAVIMMLLGIVMRSKNNIKSIVSNSLFKINTRTQVSKEEELIRSAKNYLSRFRTNSVFKEEAIPLCVPYDEHYLVRAKGAGWCSEQKNWYWPFNKQRNEVDKWLPEIYKLNKNGPHILPNMVPKGLWGVNLRSCLPKSEWKRIARNIYQKYGYHCQICGCQGTQWPVECEENWKYIRQDDKNGLVVLENLMALCPMCHRIKHLGKANIDGVYQEVVAHMAVINDVSWEIANYYSSKAFEDWEKHSEMNWKFDFSWLEKNHGIKIAIEV